MESRHATWGFKEWGLVCLLLGYAALLISAGLVQEDLDLIAGGLAIAIVTLGWLGVYLRWLWRE